jgi:glycosyltransferase involved in cell wall biosynthesis
LKLAVIGSVGVPAKYGGFETLVENLVRYHEVRSIECEIVVYCSGKAYGEHRSQFHQASLKYIPLNANGAQSLPYDVLSMFDAWRAGVDVILILGVSGAIAIPLLRLFTSTKIVTNVDGIEWKREKWKGLARTFLRFSEYIASKWSHVVIADNDEISRHITTAYGVACSVIPYGGDHVLATPAGGADPLDLPRQYALSICRIEPENNIAMILEAFSRQTAIPIVLVGNWGGSAFGRELREKFGSVPHLNLLDPIYAPETLRALHDGATLYIHGHSAGGTNPSLVEAMHCHSTILAFDCSFNRATTEDRACFFASTEGLTDLLARVSAGEQVSQRGVLKEIANRRYRWEVVSRQYFQIVGCASSPLEQARVSNTANKKLGRKMETEDA